MAITTKAGKIIRAIIPFMPHKIAHSFLFYRNHKYMFDWKNPKTYDEKMTWALANQFGEKESIYADKYRVRKYVTKCGYGYMLPKVYDVWHNASDISLDNLPNQFVMKTNNGSGPECIEICTDKSKININALKKKFASSLKKGIWKNQCEYHYKYIQPLIFAEEFLSEKKDRGITDYKLFTFNGKVKCILVCTDRNENFKRDYYDVNWNHLDVVSEIISGEHKIDKPKGLDEMIRAAEKLSDRFPTARIDFYDLDGKVFFGEITLSPAGGNMSYINNKWQLIFGDLFHLDMKKNTFTV